MLQAAGAAARKDEGAPRDRVVRIGCSNRRAAYVVRPHQSCYAFASTGDGTMADFDEAFKAYNRGDYAKALRELLPLAENGDARAQNILGQMHHEGKGVPPDATEAARWFRRAAEQGVVGAQHWLGVLYEIGNGVEQNYTEAAKWYRRAAEQGSSLDMLNFGEMCYGGHGVPRDFVQAYMWLCLAAERLSRFPGKERERAVRNREIVAKSMTPEQIAEAQRLARDWRSKAE